MADEPEYIGPVKVTVTRPDTGEVLEEKTIHNDYCVITNGDRYVKSWQMWGSSIQVNIASHAADRRRERKSSSKAGA